MTTNDNYAPNYSCLRSIFYYHKKSKGKKNNNVEWLEYEIISN